MPAKSKTGTGAGGAPNKPSTARIIGASGEQQLPQAFFGGEVNVPLMHQVVTAQLAAARSGTASTKTRSEVRGGGKKPWRQKGTGRARHGSIRSPIWVGGGTVFGPKPRDYSVKVPKKMRRAALRSALAGKAQEERVFVLRNWTEPRTKAAAAALKEAGIEGRVLVVLDPQDESSVAVDRAFRNLDGAAFSLVGSLATFDVLAADAVVFTQAALDKMTAGPGDESSAATSKEMNERSSDGPESDTVTDAGEPS